MLRTFLDSRIASLLGVLLKVFNCNMSPYLNAGVQPGGPSKISACRMFIYPCCTGLYNGSGRYGVMVSYRNPIAGHFLEGRIPTAYSKPNKILRGSD